MKDWLPLIIGVLLIATIALVAILLMRRGGITTRQGKRLSILEKLPFGRDGYFVLVRRDGAEHFVFIGEGGGFLIEANIRRKHRPEPAAPMPPQPAVQTPPPPRPAPRSHPEPQPQMQPTAPSAPPAPSTPASAQPAAPQPSTPRPAPAAAPTAPRVPPAPPAAEDSNMPKAD